jgi:RNA polymerase subunit RPABC4/transcription elongation factor Spt4/flagellar motor protein MotB
MECGSCSELIPDDSIFCPECGARQDMSRAGSFTSPNSIGLSGQEVSGGRNFGVVSGEAIRHQRDMGATDLNSISPELLQQIAQGLQNQQNIPPGSFPPQNIQSNVIPNSNQINQIPQNKQNLGNMQRNVNPNQNIMNNQQSNNVQTNSPTDQMVNRLAEAEKAMKTERRSQWLNMNQTSASNVLSSLGADLPPHLRGEDNAAKDILSGALGTQNEAPNDAFLRRMCEVAVRRVARKRGVAVETPQAKLDGDILSVNITYVDDGRVLDTPEDLKQAFEHAIQTEVALKGFDYLAEINLFRSKDGEVEDLSGESSDDEEEMFACEICEGLVKESDNSCPHCGAVFEEEDEEPAPRSPPRGPGRSSPPGPSRSPPRGPQRGPPGGPSRSNPPGGPKRSGPPGGPKRSGPPGGPKRSGPPGGPNSGPPKGGPSGGPSVGPKRGGPPGGPSKGGPPKGPKRGPPR